MGIKKYSKLYRVLILLIIAAIAIWFVYNRSSSGCKVKNVLLISIDTCRADHLGCYGYERNTTPNIDAFAKEGVLFEKTISSIPLTLPSHSTMLTGTIPPYHGVHDNLGYSLNESNITIAERLKEEGFSTGAAVSTFVLDSRFGLNQGFDYYNDSLEYGREEQAEEGKAEDTSKEAMQWIQQHKEERFFFFLHYYDPHEKYDPPEPYATEYKDDLYSGEIAYTDYWVGKVIDKLKELGLYDSTMIIITSDHGEGLGEHKESTHCFFIYQSTIHVPLIIRVPGMAANRIGDVSGLVDIVPTICSVLNIKTPAAVQGDDLTPYFTDKNYTIKDKLYYSESMVPTKYNANSLFGATSSRYKYIQTTRPELYDLVNDPKETNNLLSTQAQRGHIMQDRLSAILEDSARQNSGSEMELDAQSIKHLESLGYVAGNINEDFKFDQSKPDPKDTIQFYEADLSIVLLIKDKKLGEAKKLCKKFMKKYPTQLFPFYHLGSVLFKEGDMEEAEKVFSTFLEKVTTMYPGVVNENLADVHQKLGSIKSKLNKFDEALKHFGKALEISKNKPEIYCNFGTALFEHGKYQKAIENYNKALELTPNDTDYIITHEGLANCYIKLNNPQLAAEHLSEVLKKKPDQPEKLNNLGLLLSNSGEIDKAIEYWKMSIKLDDQQYNVHEWIATKLLEKGQVQQAIDHWRLSLNINPQQPTVSAKLGKAYYMQGKPEQTVMYWNKALELKPEMPALLNDFAWILATERDPDIKNPAEALKKAMQACELAGQQNINFLDTLSVAYAANKNFQKAIEIAEKAINLAYSKDLPELAEEIKKRLELYKTGKQYGE